MPAQQFQSRQDLFIGLSEFTEGGLQPLPSPFIGTLTDWDIRDGDIQVKDDSGQMVTKHTTSLYLQIDPHTIVLESQDGRVHRYVSWSTRKGSTAMLVITYLEAAMSKRIGKPFVAKTKDDINNFVKGQVFEWYDYPWNDGVLNAYFANRVDQYRSKKPVLLPVGPAPDGWEATVPADFKAKREAAIAKAQARAASKAAGVNPNGGGSVAPQVIGSQSATPTLELSEDLVNLVVEGLVGKSQVNRLREVAGDQAFRALIDMETLKDILSGAIPSQLIKAGKLVVDDQGLYQRALI